MGTNLAGKTRISRQNGLASQLVAGALAVIVVSVTAVNSARAQMSVDEIRNKVTADYGVTVLKVTPMESGTEAKFAVTVMNPGGNWNGAYQVNTIVVDGETGELVIQYGNKGGRQQELPVGPQRKIGKKIHFLHDFV